MATTTAAAPPPYVDPWALTMFTPASTSPANCPRLGLISSEELLTS